MAINVTTMSEASFYYGLSLFLGQPGRVGMLFITHGMPQNLQVDEIVRIGAGNLSAVGASGAQDKIDNHGADSNCAPHNIANGVSSQSATGNATRVVGVRGSQEGARNG